MHTLRVCDKKLIKYKKYCTNFFVEKVEKEHRKNRIRENIGNKVGKKKHRIVTVPQHVSYSRPLPFYIIDI